MFDILLSIRLFWLIMCVRENVHIAVEQ